MAEMPRTLASLGEPGPLDPSSQLVPARPVRSNADDRRLDAVRPWPAMADCSCWRDRARGDGSSQPLRVRRQKSSMTDTVDIRIKLIFESLLTACLLSSPVTVAIFGLL
jgi:hypothetical protein